MVTVGMSNIILDGEFYFFDGDGTTAETSKANWWRRKTPRKVKVTFEKTNGKSEEFCLRLLDPTKKHSPVYFHVDFERTAFFGTDRGKLTWKKNKLRDRQGNVTYSFLTVYVGGGDLSSRQSCVLLKTDWPEESQKHWQNTINEKLGLYGTWSVERTVGNNSERERVLLSLTSRGLALNSKYLSDGRELPTCLWFHTFSDFTIVANVSPNDPNAIRISCNRKGLREGKPIEYNLITSQGQAIFTSICRVSGLKPIPLAVDISSADRLPAENATTPPPCLMTGIFADKPSSMRFPKYSKETFLLPRPTQGIPGDEAIFTDPESTPQLRELSPRHERHAGNRVVHPQDFQLAVYNKEKSFIRKPREKSSHTTSPLRRSFSLGEQDFKSGIHYKLVKHDGGSLSGGYASESDFIDQLPPGAHRGLADRETFYLHNKWYNFFKGDVQGAVGKGSTSSMYRPSLREQPLWGRQWDTVDDDDDYWTKEISFTLQNVLELKFPHPDTLRLARHQKIRLKFLLYPTKPDLSGGWQELAGYLGLTLEDVAIVENFCLFHHYSPVEILLLHWQFVYNKQTKPQHRHFLSEPLVPPCTKSQLTKYLQKMTRFDIIGTCKFTLNPS